MRIYSFGYKMNGEDQFATTGENTPLIFDCRVLYNPHGDASLRRLTGRDKPVQDAVAASPIAREMLTEAYNYLMGDPNRSVALAELLGQRLEHAVVIHTGAAK